MSSKATSRKFLVRSGEAGARLVDFLAHALDLSKNGAKALLDRRDVFVNDRRVWMARHTLADGDTVQVLMRSEPTIKPESPATVYRDAWYLVVDKRPGVITCGEGGLEQMLRASLGLPELMAVHRLDRDTSGCLLFALGEAAKLRMIPLFRRHEVRKRYHAVVSGAVKEKSLTIRKTVDGEYSVTHLQVVGQARLATHLLVSIETGRTHQIRRHLASIGHPVVGDREYGGGERIAGKLLEAPRQMLHASELGFAHPFRHGAVRAVAPLPDDFTACLRNLGLGTRIGR